MDINEDVMSSEQCASAFGRIFWAFLFFLDFRVGFNNMHVDILPDFIGWIMIATALTAIIDLSPRVAGIRTLANWLIFLSLFDLVQIRIPLSHSGTFTTWITPTFPVGIIATILAIILIWNLCGLIIDMANVAADPTIGGRADFRRKLYVALLVLGTIAAGISLIVPPFVLLAVVVVLPMAIIVFCLMMGLMKGTENMCRSFSRL